MSDCQPGGSLMAEDEASLRTVRPAHRAAAIKNSLSLQRFRFS